MLATLEFVIGLIIGYLIISPRFRGLLLKTIQSWKPPKKEHADADGWVDVTPKFTPEITKPITQKTAKSDKPQYKNGAMVLSEEYIAQHPELKARIEEASEG